MLSDVEKCHFYSSFLNSNAFNSVTVDLDQNNAFYAVKKMSLVYATLVLNLILAFSIA